MKTIKITVKRTYETIIFVEAKTINDAKELIANKDVDTFDAINSVEMEQCCIVNDTYNYSVSK